VSYILAYCLFVVLKETLKKLKQVTNFSFCLLRVVARGTSSERDFVSANTIYSGVPLAITGCGNCL
jgi:lantibiotic modifying enzyme